MAWGAISVFHECNLFNFVTSRAGTGTDSLSRKLERIAFVFLEENTDTLVTADALHRKTIAYARQFLKRIISVRDLVLVPLD